jgi:NhaP-type Na+/H+ or K+/H+ antiporter
MLTWVAALAAGVAAQVVARRLRIPGIVVLLLTGAALGPDVLGWIDPSELDGALLGVVELAVAVILFEGGLNLERARLLRSSQPIRRLLTLGAAVTLTGAALAASSILEWSWSLSLLFGSLVIVTGPTVVGPLVAELRLRPRLATVLEAEGVLIDPIGALVAALALTVVISPAGETLRSASAELLLRIGFGAGAGVIAGAGIAWALRAHQWVPEGLSNVVGLAAVLLLFQGCEEIVRTSGLLAVTVAGVVVGNADPNAVRELREFKDQLSIMLVGLLFVLLAADVRLADVAGLGLRGAGVVAALVLAVRPLSALWSTAGSPLAWRERLFIAWIAPRGIVAAAVASVTGGELAAAGLPGGVELRALVFLTIATTVVLAGVTGLPVARLLKVRLPGRDRVAILGASGTGLVLGRALRDQGVSVVFLDANPQSCRAAEEDGFPVVFGNALEERTLARARFESVGIAVGVTQNETLNGLFIQRARELFSVPRCYVALYRLKRDVTPELLRGPGVFALFEGAHDIERWDVHVRHGDVSVATYRYVPKDDAGTTAAADAPADPPAGAVPVRAAPPRDRSIVLTVSRRGQTSPMGVGVELRTGDVVIVALLASERAEADAALRMRRLVPVAAASVRVRPADDRASADYGISGVDGVPEDESISGHGSVRLPWS